MMIAKPEFIFSSITPDKFVNKATQWIAMTGVIACVI